MALQLETHQTLPFTVSAPLKEVFEFFTDYPRSIGEMFSGLEDFLPIGGAPQGSYLWIFKPIQAGPQTLHLCFATQLTAQPCQQIQVQSIAHPQANGSIHGMWQFEEKGASTQVSMQMKLQAELAIPSFLKGMAQKFMDSHINGYFQNYASNITKSFLS